ncbi:MAG: cellulase family glycosylhydrolase, partial [Acidimicrobiales bacterium]
MGYSKFRRAVAVAAAVVASVMATASVATIAPQPAAAAAGGGQGAGFSPGSMILWGSDADLARDLDAMAATGAAWLRLDFDWPSIEQQPGIFTWGPTDRVVTAARARGLSILALPTYTPAWLRPAGTSDKQAPSDPAAFAAFVAAATARYAPLGVSTWEIWNEPNIVQFWQPRPDPAAYTALLVAASSAIKAVDPAARVLSGGLSPAVDAADGSQISPLTFLAGIYAAGGGPALDAVASHPYSFPGRPLDPATANWNQFYKLPQLHQVMVANGDGAKQIWGTEYGAPTAGPGSVSEAEQAAYVSEAYAAFASWSWAGPLLWYSQRDAGADPGDREHHFGLLNRDYSPKPAAAAFARAVGAPAAQAQPVTVPPVTVPPSPVVPPVTVPPSPVVPP